MSTDEPSQPNQNREQLLRRFTAAYTRIDPGTIDLYFKQLHYYLELCDWHGNQKPATREIKRDRKLYERYLVAPHAPLDDDKLHAYLDEASGISHQTSKTIEWAEEVFDGFSNREDPETLVANQESGNGLPLEPGFSCLGKYVGEVITHDGTIELRDNCAATETLDQYFLLIKRDNHQGFESRTGEIAVRLTDHAIQDFGEMLEDICGTRSQRTKVEKECNVNAENRALPFATIKKRRKPLKRRFGFGELLCGLQAESNAVVELREGQYSPYLLIEEAGSIPHVKTLKYVPEDPYNDDEEEKNIAIAQLNHFQLIELFEIAEPFLGRRIPAHERLLVNFLRADAMRSTHLRLEGHLSPNAPIENQLDHEH